MFQMLGVFAEFERSMIQERIRAGLERARAQGVTLGRRRVSCDEQGILKSLRAGQSVRKTAARFLPGNLAGLLVCLTRFQWSNALPFDHSVWVVSMTTSEQKARQKIGRPVTKAN